MLAESRDTLFRKRRHLLKIDFALQGFSQIKNVILQRNGLFGYYLKSSQLGGETSGVTCMVRI